MIIGIEGRPGSGKSYLALEQIYDSLSRGKVVYTNMRNIFIHKVAWAIHRATGRPRDEILSRFRILETWEIERVWKEKIENCEIFLDEVMTCWLSRDWSKMDRGLIEWFSQHRKYRVNFTYIAQSIDRVDGTLRDMTQEFISIRNFAYYRLGPFRLPQVFLAVHYAEDRRLSLKREWIIPLKRFYEYYDSWALFPTKPPVDRKGNVVGIRRGVLGAAQDGAAISERDLRLSREELMIEHQAKLVELEKKVKDL
jgi:hypothetical protein